MSLETFLASRNSLFNPKVNFLLNLAVRLYKILISYKEYFFFYQKMPDMMIYTCNLNIWEAEARRLQKGGQSE